MAKFTFKETIAQHQAITSRLGAGTGSANHIDDKEVGKFVKLVADSRYDLAAAGDPIEGAIIAVEPATLDDYSIGSVVKSGRLSVVLDGLEATPGTGTIAIGDYVVVGTVVAKGTALSASPKVTKATNQPGATVTTVDATKPEIDIALAKVVDQLANSVYAWKLVSASGTAVGSTGVIERVNLGIA